MARFLDQYLAPHVWTTSDASTSTAMQDDAGLRLSFIPPSCPSLLHVPPYLMYNHPSCSSHPHAHLALIHHVHPSIMFSYPSLSSILIPPTCSPILYVCASLMLISATCSFAWPSSELQEKQQLARDPSMLYMWHLRGPISFLGPPVSVACHIGVGVVTSRSTYTRAVAVHGTSHTSHHKHTSVSPFASHALPPPPLLNR